MRSSCFPPLHSYAPRNYKCYVMQRRDFVRTRHAQVGKLTEKFREANSFVCISARAVGKQQSIRSPSTVLANFSRKLQRRSFYKFSLKVLVPAPLHTLVVVPALPDRRLSVLN